MTLQIQQATIRPIPNSSQQISALTTAAPLTPPVGASLAVITVTGQSVRYKDDGTAPDATHGVIIPVTTLAPFYYWGDLAAVRFIQTTAGAVMDVLYYATT